MKVKKKRKKWLQKEQPSLPEHTNPTTYMYDVKNPGFGWEQAQKYGGVILANEILALLS